MNIWKRQHNILFSCELQSLQQLVERNELDPSAAALGFVRGLRAFANATFFTAERDENIALRCHAGITAARIHDHLHEMIDLRLARLLNRHGNRKALSCEYLLSLIFGTNGLQKDLKHRSVRMDIRAKNFEILRFAPYTVIAFILTEVNVLGRADLLYDVHGRARVLLALMYIHGLLDCKDLASAVETDLSALLKHVRIQTLAVQKAEFQRGQAISLASLAKKIDVVLHGMSDHKLILALQKRADLSIKGGERRRFSEFLLRISKQYLGIFGSSRQPKSGFRIDHQIVTFQFMKMFIRNHIAEGANASLSAVRAFNIKKYVSQQNILSENLLNFINFFFLLYTHTSDLSRAF